ncbi:hypothetical protein Tco_0379408 [Tanacetum coccineum]
MGPQSMTTAHLCAIDRDCEDFEGPILALEQANLSHPYKRKALIDRKLHHGQNRGQSTDLAFASVYGFFYISDWMLSSALLYVKLKKKCMSLSPAPPKGFEDLTYPKHVNIVLKLCIDFIKHLEPGGCQFLADDYFMAVQEAAIVATLLQKPICSACLAAMGTGTLRFPAGSTMILHFDIHPAECFVSAGAMEYADGTVFIAGGILLLVDSSLLIRCVFCCLQWFLLLLTSFCGLNTHPVFASIVYAVDTSIYVAELVVLFDIGCFWSLPLVTHFLSVVSNLLGETIVSAE